MNKKNNTHNLFVINDIVCSMNCSSFLYAPIANIFQNKCFLIPTALFSNNTADKNFVSFDLNKYMTNIYNNINKNYKCEAILVGYLNNLKQINETKRIIKNNKNAFIVVDPIFGDNGKKYKNLSDQYINHISKLCKLADIICPNITEAKILINDDTFKPLYTEEEIHILLNKLYNKYKNTVIITGIIINNQIYTFAYNKKTNIYFKYATSIIQGDYYGSGDIFSYILVNCLLLKIDLYDAITIAVNFIYRSIRDTKKNNNNTDTNRKHIMINSQLNHLNKTIKKYSQ